MERVGFDNFVEEEAILEEGNYLELLLLFIKSFLLLDVVDCVCVLGLCLFSPRWSSRDFGNFKRP